MSTITTLIDTGWEFAERVPAGRDLSFLSGGEASWLPAQVPGHVHGDLVREGVLGDPFYRMNERSARWVDEADWTYRTAFTVEADRLARGGRHFLHFHGLDTIARVYVNDALVGQTENYFVPHRFEVGKVIQAGENQLRIEFDSALRVGQERAVAYLGDGTSAHGSQSYFNYGPRAFVRKPQYMFGWDWGPELVSCGIHAPVEFVSVPVAEIVDWGMDYDFTDPITVEIRLQITVEKYDASPLTVGAALYAPGDNTPSAPLPSAPGRHTVTLLIRNQKVARWNPNGMTLVPTVNGVRPLGGPQKRTLLNLRVWRTETNPNAETETIAHKGVSVGFRTVELVQEPDADGAGAGMIFRINGVDTFMKGANWIPDHSLPSAITRAQLRERLTQARDAGMNMLRVWGGGLYESDDFYDLCDELGLLVWQDFGFACSMYPDDDASFVENVRAEAVANVRRLRHRACLALWCGGNENLELFQGRWAGKTQATTFFGDKLIHEVLPAVLTDEDTRTPYLPNSPYGGEPCTSEDFGDSHYWNVWHAKTPDSDGDWVHYNKSRTRFSSEFGFASSCGLRAWDSCLAPEDKTPRSPVVRAHDKTRKGYEKFLGYIEKHFPAIETLDDLVYYGQANQALALQFGVEHWRRMKGRCWGTLFWQLNDCWPTQSWAVIDSAGEPKAAYYAAKRFYAPLLVSLVRENDSVAAYLVNDGLADVAARVTLSLFSANDKELARVESDVVANANAASDAPVATLPIAIGAVFAHVTLNAPDGAMLAENLLLLVEPKELAVAPLSPDALAIDIGKVAGGNASITVRAAAERLAWGVFLSLDSEVATTQLRWSDNFFFVPPGEARTVTLQGVPENMNADALGAALRVRHL